MNKMDRMHEDVTEICAALDRVCQCLDSRKKPESAHPLVSKLTFADLPTVAAEHGVVFVPNLTDMSIFQDESAHVSNLPDVEAIVDIGTLPYKISDWLSRAHDQTYDWKLHGLQHQRFSVNESEVGLRSTNKQRSHPVALALHKAAAMSRDTRRAIDRARVLEEEHFSHLSVGVGLSVIDKAADWLEDLTPVKSSLKSWYDKRDSELQLAMFSNVLSVAHCALKLEEARDNNLHAPARRARPNCIDYNGLQKLREKSTLYSSSFWNL